jgi:hypothetical protein
VRLGGLDLRLVLVPVPVPLLDLGVELAGLGLADPLPVRAAADGGAALGALGAALGAAARGRAAAGLGAAAAAGAGGVVADVVTALLGTGPARTLLLLVRAGARALVAALVSTLVAAPAALGLRPGGL